VSVWRRLFFPGYRRAVTLEALGRYEEAAAAYALAGDSAKVADMQLLLGSCASDTQERLRALRSAVRAVGSVPLGAKGEPLRRRTGEALLAFVEGDGGRSHPDARALLGQAAALLSNGGDPQGAARCYALLGDRSAEADSWERAGEIDRLEALLTHEAEERRVLRETTRAQEELEAALAAGHRRRAIALLRAHPNRADCSRRLRALEARTPVPHRVTLRGPFDEAEPTIRRLIGALPVVLGREATSGLALRDPGLSRAHAELALDAAGRLLLSDLDSRNGTRVGGLPLGGPWVCDATTDFELGEGCTVRLTPRPRGLRLEVVRGVDRGLVADYAEEEWALPGGARLRFDAGWPLADAPPGGCLTLQRGEELPAVQRAVSVELLVGDRLTTLDAEGRSTVWEVLA
jgi:tetratricopeptide (TPR) repeat protein